MRRALKCPKCGKLTYADFVREWIFHVCDHCSMVLDRREHAVAYEVDVKEQETK